MRRNASAIVSPPTIGSSTAPLERALGARFKNRALLEEALTHKSYAMELGGALPYNERLEFLGDSVLSAAVAHYLFNRYPDVDEGRLSQLKSALVSRPSLTVWGRDLDVGQFLRLSEGENASGGRDRDSIVGNAMEALIGALYLDAGFDAARALIEKLLAKRKRPVTVDHKSRLQEWVQQRYKAPPAYEVLRSFGPDHAKTFEVEVVVAMKRLGLGAGKTKKEAQQAAARDALKKIKDA